MRVQIRQSDGNGMIRERVHHINVRTGGALVLRFSGHKETIRDGDYSGFEVSDA